MNLLEDSSECRTLEDKNCEPTVLWHIQHHLNSTTTYWEEAD